MLCAFVLTACLPVYTAFAEDIDTDPTPSDLQERVEYTARALDEAVARVEELQTAIEENSKRIATLEKQIPAQRKRSNTAARELYKMQSQQFSFVEFLLRAEDLPDFIKLLEYGTHITDSSLAELDRLTDMMNELQESQEQLERDKAAADQQAADAEQALLAAQAARVEAQRRAEEEARRQAEEAAAAVAAAQAAEEAKAKAEAQAAGEEPEEDPEPDEDSTSVWEEPEPEYVPDDTDWSLDEATFVAQWASRINSYLAGSPLYGYGANFAQAAWDYGVDPRFSPAISMVESSKGAYCFLPHNAWGWGSVSWDSWEEAIDDHVRGLARGYGYTATIEGAYKYCPPNAEHWYNRVVEEMGYI